MSLMMMSMTATNTASSTAAAASTTSTMSGMQMGGTGMGADCKISMLWNWYTVDTCFISSSWHVTSRGMFAGSCIGVILLVCSLEFLRRFSKEYDAYLSRNAQLRGYHMTHPEASDEASYSGNGSTSPKGRRGANMEGGLPNKAVKPTLAQQLVRALLHTLQFGVAYFIMLLAMYYNGYIIICILIGAFVGSFVFTWESFGGGSSSNHIDNPTVCCG